MARQCWVNPSPPSGGYTKRDIVFVDRAVAPASSPAPVGNPVVPTGWVKQIGSDGEQDTTLTDNRTGTPQTVPNITQWVVPYFTGGWPPDPLFGTPGHDQQRPTGQG